MKQGDSTMPNLLIVGDTGFVGQHALTHWPQAKGLAIQFTI